MKVSDPFIKDIKNHPKIYKNNLGQERSRKKLCLRATLINFIWGVFDFPVRPG
jgi:hypothetical protein